MIKTPLMTLALIFALVTPVAAQNVVETSVPGSKIAADIILEFRMITLPENSA